MATTHASTPTTAKTLSTTRRKTRNYARLERLGNFTWRMIKKPEE